MKKQILLILCYMGLALQASAQEFVDINGNIYPLSSVTKIRSSWQEHPASLSLLLQADNKISLFREALEATGWMDSLKCYADPSYTVGADSTTWMNDMLCVHTAVEYDNVAYMPQRLIAHTVFAETDSVYNQKGIKSLSNLKAYAKKVYDAVYPEDAGLYDNDPTNLKNPLNRFVAYHILPFSAGYYQLTAIDGGRLAYNFNRNKWDVADWYETCMPYSTMKCSFPSGAQEGLYINRRGVQERADARGVFVRGAKIATPEAMGERGDGINGKYHYIDDIIDYGQQTQQVVLNERMRFDCTTLSPDFMTSGARGHLCRTPQDEGRYGRGGQMSRAAENVNTCLGFKAGSAKNFEFGNSTHLHVRPRVLNFWSYQADEVTIKGYDVKVKLPPVPAGKYELRLGTCTGFESRGIVAFFIDGVPACMVDMRPDGYSLFGWKLDSQLADEETITSFDRSSHNKGWMKGPKCYQPADRNEYIETSSMRDFPNVLRRVIGTFYTDGKTDHYLQMKPLTGSGYNEMDFDYIELVPATVYDDDLYVEDRW